MPLQQHENRDDMTGWPSRNETKQALEAGDRTRS
ncbi:hypothetical protein HTG_16425 [Natrinema mahii]|nr:hypothetical protein HTG_16425 [Natrinema mahii]